MAYFRCSQIGGGTVDPSVIKYGTLTSTTSATQTISRDKTYIVCACEKGGSDATVYRMKIWKVSQGTVTVLQTGDTNVSVLVSGTTLTISGNSGTYRKDFAIIQIN